MNKEIEGSYNNGTARVSIKGNAVIVNMPGSGRPTASGEIDGNKGYVTHPDDGTRTFEYDAEEKIIYWDGRDSGNKWIKD